MGNYRIIGEAASASVCAQDVAAALSKFLRDYSTSGLMEHEEFTVRVYDEETDELVFTSDAKADGKGGVNWHSAP